jgi:hypothetical protein
MSADINALFDELEQLLGNCCPDELEQPHRQSPRIYLSVRVRAKRPQFFETHPEALLRERE